MAKKSSDNLTPEDRRLWKKVTETVTPKAQRTQEEMADEDKLFFEAMEKKSPANPPSKQILKSSSSLPETPQPFQSKPVAQKLSRASAPPVKQVDRRTKSRLARGLVEIDGRIDLHGMNQNQAHASLQAFIGRAYASGWKMVLVITGKGAQSLSDNQYDPLQMGKEAPGVLRRKVPQWLQDKNLRHFVAEYGAAAQVHGGNGALYVRIRKNRN